MDLPGEPADYAGGGGFSGPLQQPAPGSPPRAPYGEPPAPTFRSPRITYSDRFIPSRAVSARLDYSILDREAAASETPRRTAEKEEGNGAYNMLLRSELLGCPGGGARSPEKGTSSVHVSSPSKRCGAARGAGPGAWRGAAGRQYGACRLGACAAAGADSGAVARSRSVATGNAAPPPCVHPEACTKYFVQKGVCWAGAVHPPACCASLCLCLQPRAEAIPLHRRGRRHAHRGPADAVALRAGADWGRQPHRALAGQPQADTSQDTALAVQGGPDGSRALAAQGGVCVEAGKGLGGANLLHAAHLRLGMQQR